jgi:hypothetical protein
MNVLRESIGGSPLLKLERRGPHEYEHGDARHEASRGINDPGAVSDELCAHHYEATLIQIGVLTDTTRQLPCVSLMPDLLGLRAPARSGSGGTAFPQQSNVGSVVLMLFRSTLMRA